MNDRIERHLETGNPRLFIPRVLDEVVFDALGLTAGEREAVYEAVVALVRARLEKARSV